MKRVFFDSYRSVVNSQARRTGFNVYFTSNEREKFIWTPDWEGETRRLFLEAYNLIQKTQRPVKKAVEKVVVRVAREEKPEGEIIDFGPLAFKVGETLKNKTTEGLIENIASALFNFKVELHTNVNISNIKSQSIYDWVMTLGEQPISQETKIKLLRKFIGALAPLDSPLKKLAEPG
jgi:hypothetical protein